MELKSIKEAVHAAVDEMTFSGEERKCWPKVFVRVAVAQAGAGLDDALEDLAYVDRRIDSEIAKEARHIMDNLDHIDDLTVRRYIRLLCTEILKEGE